MTGENKSNRGPASKEAWLEGVLKSFSDYQRFQDAELAAEDIRQAFLDGLKLEPDARGSSPHVFDCKSYPHLTPAPPTVDDLVERRIAQAERVVALYRLWADTLWPRDLVGIVEDVPNEEPPTFKEWLEEQTAAIVKALAIPGNYVGDGAAGGE